MLTRRAILVGAPQLTYVGLPLKTKPCHREDHKQKWREYAQLCVTTEVVVRETKLFYQGLATSNHMTQEIFEHFNTVREIAKLDSRYSKFVVDMQQDAADFNQFSSCLDA